MTREEAESLELAAKAFGLMTLAEKARALTVMAHLRYPSAVDRFFEGVHKAIQWREEHGAKR